MTGETRIVSPPEAQKALDWRQRTFGEEYAYTVATEPRRIKAAVESLQGRVDTVLELHQPSTANVVTDWPEGTYGSQRSRPACTGCSYAYDDCPTRAILVVKP